jgi:GYF domain 2/Domain of unknown function (DUF4234)
MNYFVIRDGQEYGPYSLALLQQYVAQGNVSMNDQARSEGLKEAVTVQQIVGNISVPSAPAPQQSYGQIPGYIPGPGAEAVAGKLPPGLHWGLVLLFSILTFGIFTWVWMFVQASFVRKIRPASKALVYYAIALPGVFIGAILVELLKPVSPEATKSLSGLVQFGFWILMLVGHYSLRNSLEEYYTQVENIQLHLSGVMTFFFNVIYFQYHLNRIRRWKQTGVLS